MPLEGIELGRYRIVRLIRRGGMSEVYLAEDTRLSRQVAIKTIQNEASLYPNESEKQEVSRLFQREMSIVSRLYHPHILQLYDFGEEVVNGAGLEYMVMPFHAEGSLVDWLRQRSKGGLLAVEDAVGLIGQAADALQYAHDHQIMHLDVKPSNFLVRVRREKPEQPDLFLADFGIAKVAATSKGSSTMRGTLEYMAPEQWNGHPVAASDQYSLAIMAYELLTGSVPFRGTVSQIMFKHFQEIPQPPGRLNSRIPPTFDAIILRALAKKPEERFASVSEFAQVLQRGLQGSGEMQQINVQRMPLRATLTISAEEARYGAQRTLALPNGRRVIAAIPAGIVEGHVIRFNAQGEAYDKYNLAEVPLLEITIHVEDENKPSTDSESQKVTIKNKLTTVLVPVKQKLVVWPLLSDLPRSVEQVAHSILALLLSKRRQTRYLFLSLAAACLVIASIISFTAYQNNVNPPNNVAANPYPAYFTGQGTIALSDPLDRAGNWSDSSNTSSGGTCIFTGGAYHVSMTNAGNYYDCYPPKSYGNFAFQVQMTILQGDCGGITFREDSAGVNFYAFRVCQNGNYYLDVHWNGTSFSTEKSGSNSSINRGLNQRNSIAVLANADAISVYANGHLVDGMNDSVYSNGTIGLLAFDMGNATEVAYNDAKVWTF